MARQCKTIFAFCAANLAVADVLPGTDPIVITPDAGKTGADKVLIVINGAKVPNVDYIEVAQAIQKASDLKLWVAIPTFLIDTPNPAEIGGKITGGISAIQDAGFPGGVDSASDVIVAGHSLGGIFSQGAVVSGDYTGLVLLGSYLSTINGFRVDTYPKPALTLGGELDGLTRVSRIAQSIQELRTRVAAEGDGAKYTHPVVVLPGQTHSQFNSNLNVTAFGTKDKCPEVSDSQAHEEIGHMVSAFMTLVFGSGDSSSAKSRIDSGMAYTEELLGGYISATELIKAGQTCKDAQESEAALASVSVECLADVTTSATVYDTKSPSIDTSAGRVTAIAYAPYRLNPGDLSTSDLSAEEQDCKIATAETLAKKFSGAASQSSNSCQTVNDAVLAQALSLVTPATLDRYHRNLKPIVTAPDVDYSTGITWKAANFKFEDKGDKIEVTSPRLVSLGEQLCKYLSHDRVIEYLMTDGLPAFDACPTSAKIIV
jgi:hypothetical protein